MRTAMLSALCCIFIATSGYGTDVFSRIRIQVPDIATLQRVWSSGIDYEGVTGKVGGAMEFVAGSGEKEALARLGITYAIVTQDLAAENARHLPAGPADVFGFGYGSMGGYYTYAEVLRQLDTMRLLYPSLITIRDSIGQSQEGRGMWAVKISDSPEEDDPTEPEVLYTALHHAREPEGMMSALYYMWWLLENYGTNPEATYLVNSRQLWFIPVVNPDGYVYNQTTNPNGGGMWRKNRRNNGSTFGVDLNRNYGPMYMWDSPFAPNGSSTSPSSDTYRGPAPFSEPELQAIDLFMRAHDFKTCLNYHTYGNYLIYPYGYLAHESGDSVMFRDWTYTLAAVNRFTNGTDIQTVNYSTRGVADDYMYGDSTKTKTYTLTPEVGTTGFWPSVGEIFPLAIANLAMNKELAYFAGALPALRGLTIVDQNGNGYLEPGEQFTLQFLVRNRGVRLAENFTFAVTPSSSHILLTSQGTPLPQLEPQVEAPVGFAGTVNAAAPAGLPVQFYCTMSDIQGFVHRDTLTVFIGLPSVVFSDSASGGTSHWTTGSGWGVTSNAHTPPFAFTDSPAGAYATNSDNALTLVSPLNLNGFAHASLKFWTRWSVEPTWDFATVEASANGGGSWTTLHAPLSHTGSARSGSKQPAGSWGFDSYTPGLTWVEQEIDLTGYVNHQTLLRFRMAADGGDNRDGIYVDDIRVLGYMEPADTVVTITPGAIAAQGTPGTRFDRSIVVTNPTSSPVTYAVSESVLTSPDQRPFAAPAAVHFPTERILSGLRSQRLPSPTPAAPAADPQAFTTTITDNRGDNYLLGVDVLTIESQKRSSIVGTVLDLRIRAVNPDSGVIGTVSIDTDQDFGTGTWPPPFGFGVRPRDVGSEFELLVDASGFLGDSLGLGAIPIAVLLRSADSAIVGLPFFPTVTHDSLLTITVSGIPFGSLGLNDADQNLNIAATFVRIAGGLPIPDAVPDAGHGTIGTETGAGWIRESRTSITVPPGGTDSLVVSILAASTGGTYGTMLRFVPTGQPQVNVPVTLTVTAPGNAILSLSATQLSDTVAAGDSTSMAVTVSNTGSGLLAWAFADTAATPWMSVTPAFGSLDPSQSTQTVITVRSAGFPDNTTLTSRFAVISNDATTPVRLFPVTLRIQGSTGVGTSAPDLPITYALAQNYPNPFNPQTRISFDLPVATHALLKVTNVLGEDVVTLVDGDLPAGVHTVEFAASLYGLPSGVYWYTLRAGEFNATRKMMLLR